MSRLNVYAKNSMKIYLAIVMIVFLFAGCSGNADSEHTTATTVVQPPPRQVLRDERRPGPRTPLESYSDNLYNPSSLGKPLLVLNLPKKDQTFREGEEVVIDFSLHRVKLRGEGGEYRVRYMVDDDDMQWIDRWEQVVLTGWLPGKHTIRVELIGPDGWPYRNGDFNIATREITIDK